MMNDKKLTIKKWLRRILFVLAFCLVFGFGVKLLNYMYVEDVKDPWFRIFWHNYYADSAENNIDNIYLGSSHVYSGLNPFTMDELTGEYNYNISTSEQRLNGSYYLLKEVCRDNDVKHVYLDLFYRSSCVIEDEDNADPINTGYNYNWQNTDYMKLSLNKICYMLSIADTETYPEIALPFIRYRSELDNWAYVKNIMKAKDDENYQNYIYVNEYDDSTGHNYTKYTNKGFRDTNIVLRDDSRITERYTGITEEPMGQESEKYLRKIIEYCENHDIELTLFVTPVDDLLLLSAGDYDLFLNQVEGIAAEYGVDFYDFNLAKEEYLDLWHNEYFWNTGHLNTTGANIFTEFFHKVVSEGKEASTEYFYDSYASKIASQDYRFYGIDFVETVGTDDAGNEVTMNHYSMVSNQTSGYEYQITIQTIDENLNYGDEEVICDWTENPEFEKPADQDMIIYVRYRALGDTDENNVQGMAIQYYH